MDIKIVQCSFHRNGISGNGFYAVLFDWTQDGTTNRMVATVFDEPGSVAVLMVSGLSDERIGVKFGHNSWRGDNFEADLRRLIDEQKTNRAGPFSIPDFDAPFTRKEMGLE